MNLIHCVAANDRQGGRSFEAVLVAGAKLRLQLDAKQKIAELLDGIDRDGLYRSIGRFMFEFSQPGLSVLN